MNSPGHSSSVRRSASDLRQMSTDAAKFLAMTTSLTADAIARLLAAGRQYRSVGVVTASRVIDDCEWTTSSGDVLQARAGDWEVSDGTDTWSVAGNIFTQTYVQVEGNNYRKASQVTAVAMAESFAVETLEGLASGEPGDWLVRNPSGECWPVPAAVFSRRYELS